MEKSVEINEKKSKSKKNWISIVLILIIAALVVVLITTNNKLKTLIAEKEQQRVELKSELDSLIIEHDSIKTEYGMLSKSLVVKDSIIQSNAKEIKKLLNTEYKYYLVRKKLRALRKISQSYVHQMDSLYTVNKKLKIENAQLASNFKKEKNTNIELSKDKEKLSQKVSQASVLKAYNIIAESIHLRGGRKEVVNNKARRLDKIKISFTLSENKIIAAGTKVIYIRIARPDKLILTKSKVNKYTFLYKGKTLQYSIKKEIDYENQAMDLCLYWTKRHSEKAPITGTYTVTIFSDDNVIGETHFKLR